MINLSVPKLKEKILDHKCNKRNISKTKRKFSQIRSHFPNTIRMHTHTPLLWLNIKKFINVVYKKYVFMFKKEDLFLNFYSQTHTEDMLLVFQIIFILQLWWSHYTDLRIFNGFLSCTKTNMKSSWQKAEPGKGHACNSVRSTQSTSQVRQTGQDTATTGAE